MINKKDDDEEIDDHHENNDDDDFGLPDMEYDSNLESDSSSSYEEKRKRKFPYEIGEEESNTSKTSLTLIISVIILLTLIGGSIWYFMFYAPEKDKIIAKEKAKQEAVELKKEADDRAIALKKKKEAEALALAEKSNLKKEEEVVEFKVIEERTGRYYIVLESFVDKDFARDYGKKIANDGVASFMIPPYARKRMQRISVGAYMTLEEAKNNLGEAIDKYGKNKWILKY